MHEQDTSPIEADPIVAAVVVQEVADLKLG
jgi:hypothetical protein